MVTLVSAPGLLVFLVARSSFFTWATANIEPLNKRALNRIRFISDVVPFCREYTRKMEAGDSVPSIRRQGDALFRSGTGDTQHHSENAGTATPRVGNGR